MVGFICSAYLLYILRKTRIVRKKKLSRTENSEAEYTFFSFCRLSEPEQGKSYSLAYLLIENLTKIREEQEEEPIAKSNTITSIPELIQLPTNWDSITAEQLCEQPIHQQPIEFPEWEEPEQNSPTPPKEPVYNDWNQIPFPKNKNNSQ